MKLCGDISSNHDDLEPETERVPRAQEKTPDAQHPPPQQEEQGAQQEVGLMSGDGVQALASVARREELDFGRDQAGVVAPQAAAASCSFTHGVVAPHGVSLPQRVLVRQFALLQSLN